MSGLIRRPNNGLREALLRILSRECAIDFGLVELNCREDMLESARFRDSVYQLRPGACSTKPYPLQPSRYLALFRVAVLRMATGSMSKPTSEFTLTPYAPLTGEIGCLIILTSD
jgi:hypothetical protein